MIIRLLIGFYLFQVKIWFQNRRMKWRNSKERELLSSGGSRESTLPNKSNPNPDLSDVRDEQNEQPFDMNAHLDELLTEHGTDDMHNQNDDMHDHSDDMHSQCDTLGKECSDLAGHHRDRQELYASDLTSSTPSQQCITIPASTGGQLPSPVDGHHLINANMSDSEMDSDDEEITVS